MLKTLFSQISISALNTVFVAALFYASSCGTLYAADDSIQPELSEESEILDDETAENETVLPTEYYGTVRSGYRFISANGQSAFASPYSRTKSSAVLGLAAGSMGKDMKLSVLSTFINEDDYHGELLFDGGGAYRFHLESQALWHNLPKETPVPLAMDLTPGKNYNLRVSTNEVTGKIRLGNNPFHLTLGYFELHRKGDVQNRFSDFYFGNEPSSMVSTTAAKDQTTREGKLGLDGQFASVGIAYNFRIRDFSEDSPLNRYMFTNSAGGASIPGNQAYSVIPHTQTISHTIKIYSDMSGGLTGTATYSHLTTENNGGAGDATPASKPKETVQLAAGDIRYTPSKEISFALKYRHQDIDKESPLTLITPNIASISSLTSSTTPQTMTSTNGLLLVPWATDSRRDTIALSASYQPFTKLQFRLEYLAENDTRSDMMRSHSLTPENDSRLTHKSKATVSWKPYNGIKLSALYSYANCDNPAYNNSFSEQHQGQFFATMTKSSHWGATVSYLGRYETATFGSQLDNSSLAPSLPRESLNNSVNASIWFAPLKRLTITTSYAFLANATDQTLLLSSLSKDFISAGNYRSTAHQYGIDSVYALSEKIDVGASFQQIFSSSRFSLPHSSFNYTDPNTAATTSYSTDGITELTAMDATETAIAARGELRFNSHYGISVEYGFREYLSESALFNAKSHTIMTLINGHW